MILFLPGVIWARIDIVWARQSKASDVEFFVLSFLYGLASYAVTYALFELFVGDFEVISIEKPNIFNYSIAYELICATFISFAGGIAWLYASNYKIMARFLQFIRATKQYGDEDVWDFTFNSRSKSVGFINWRDFEQKLG